MKIFACFFLFDYLYIDLVLKEEEYVSEDNKEESLK
jgi:hypothetical protein